MLELTLSSPFYSRKQHPNSLSHSAVSLSGDGSYCISYKTKKRRRLISPTHAAFFTFKFQTRYWHLTLFLSSLFSSMSRLNFCWRSASSMRRASASTGSGPAAPR